MIAWYTALVLTTLLILGLLWQFRAEVVLFLLSLAIEAAIHPLIGVFERRGLRRGIAIAVAYGAILTVVGGLFLLASSHLVANFKQVTDDILITYDQIKNCWLNGNNPSLNSLAAQMPLSQDLYTSLTGEEASVALQTIFGAAQGMFGFLTSLAMVIVLSVYWSLNHVQFERLWLSLLPVETRARARFIWLSIQSGAGTYLRREATLSFLAVILFWIGYMALGVRYATLLALIGAFARLIPWLGSILVVFLPLVAGSTLGWWGGPGAAVYTLIVIGLVEIVLRKSIFPRQKYSSLLLVLFMMAMGDAFGLPGVIFAPILSVSIQILFTNFLSPHPFVSVEVPAQTMVYLQNRNGKYLQNVRTRWMHKIL